MSSDSDLSDINLLVIEITKHRRKWLRKRVRPIKKMANQVKSKYERTRMRYDNVQKAKVKSQLENKQRQLVNKSHTFDWIILAYLAIAGHGHYDACIKPAIAGRTQLQNSPSKTVEETANMRNINSQQTDDTIGTPSKSTKTPHQSIATPRKAANNKSPQKKNYTRKRKSDSTKWKKRIRKHLRNVGKEYFSPTAKKQIAARSLKPHNCTRCRFNCADKVPENIRLEIFYLFYDENMVYERKRDFICRHIEVQPVSKRYSISYKRNSRTYYLPEHGSLQRVCKKLFIQTLDISDEMIRCTLSRKTHGTFEGTDKRGKHTPANKTSDETLDSIRQHIMSFPIMDSHYKRKDTNRKFLQQDLSITKMYDLYKAKCTAEEIIPASSITYRRVFCNEFNFSFHKPKKDSCEYCNAYSEKEKK